MGRKKTVKLNGEVEENGVSEDNEEEFHEIESNQ